MQNNPVTISHHATDALWQWYDIKDCQLWTIGQEICIKFWQCSFSTFSYSNPSHAELKLFLAIWVNTKTCATKIFAVFFPKYSKYMSQSSPVRVIYLWKSVSALPTIMGMLIPHKFMFILKLHPVSIIFFLHDSRNFPILKCVKLTQGAGIDDSCKGDNAAKHQLTQNIAVEKWKLLFH